MAARLDVVEFQGQADRIINEVSRALVGKHDALRLALVAMAADGHILIEDLPGLGKTLMARSFASALGLDFKRVQFTPDLMPADITGTSIYNQASGGFEFRSGPVFTNLLLADEINRAPAKTQAALLEAMQARHALSMSHFWSSQHKTPSSSKVRIPFRKPSWTAFSVASRSATRTRTTRPRYCSDGWNAARMKLSSTRSWTRSVSGRCRRHWKGFTCPARSCATSSPWLERLAAMPSFRWGQARAARWL